MKLNNKYFILRHGEALSNVKDTMSSWPEKKRFPLTKKGRKQIKEAVEKIKKENIDFIFSSDLLRTRESAEIIGKALKIKPKYDKRIREYNFGVFNGMLLKSYQDLFSDQLKRFHLKPKNGENYKEIEERMYSFLKDLEKAYKGKSILIVSHQLPIILLLGRAERLSHRKIFEKYIKPNRIKNGEIVKL